MKIIRLTLILIITTLILAGCGLVGNSSNIDDGSIPKEAFSKLGEDEQLKVERSTPVMLMNMYFAGINEDKPLLSVATLHPDVFTGNESLEDAKKQFIGYKIENISVKEDDEKNTKINTSKEFHLIVDFEVVELEEGSDWAAGEGKHTRFVKLVKTKEDVWAIRELATSP